MVMCTGLPFLERLRLLYRVLSPPVDAGICCTPEEFEDLKNRPFLAAALEEGIVLYEKGTP